MHDSTPVCRLEIAAGGFDVFIIVTNSQTWMLVKLVDQSCRNVMFTISNQILRLKHSV